jgi:hypothetical protein
MALAAGRAKNYLGGGSGHGVNPEDVLPTIGEMAITIAGFTGILSAASILSSFGMWLPYSGGLLVLQLAWSLFVAAITLVATLAIAFRRTEPIDRLQS